MELNLKEATREYLELKMKNTSLGNEIKENKSRLAEIERDFKFYMTDAEVKSVETDFGRFKLVDKDTYQISDKQAMIDWCAQAGRADVVQSRVNSAVLREMLKEDGLLPEGVNMNIIPLAQFSVVRKK